MIRVRRLVAALAYAGAAFLFAMALGERGELGYVQPVFAVVIVVATVILTIVSKRNRPQVVFTGAMLLGGLLLGQRQFARAWEECLVEGPRVRARIEAYFAEHDGYPVRLENLDGPLPCRCALRSTILRYLSNENGFRLWMSNDRETIVFTASGKSSGRRPN